MKEYISNATSIYRSRGKDWQFNKNTGRILNKPYIEGEFYRIKHRKKNKHGL